MMTDLNSDAFQKISHLLKNSDSDRVKLSEIDRIIKQMKKGQEESIDDKREWILNALNNNPNGIHESVVFVTLTHTSMKKPLILLIVRIFQYVYKILKNVAIP